MPWFDENDYFRDIEPAKRWYSYARLCSSCWEDYTKPGSENIEKMEKYAESHSKSVEVFSSNYRGKIPKSKTVSERSIESSHYKSKNKAEEELKYIASYFGYDLIYNLKWLRKEESEETSRTYTDRSGFKFLGLYRYSV